MSLFATKPLKRIIAESEGEHALKRTLGPVQLVALGIGAIIGAGLFSLTGIAAASVEHKHWSPSLVGLRDERGQLISEGDCPVLLAIHSGVTSLRRLSVAGRSGQPL